MVRTRIKVGPKGQIVIPKAFREGEYVMVEPRNEGLLVRRIEDPESFKGLLGRLGDPSTVDLEEEFEH